MGNLLIFPFFLYDSLSITKLSMGIQDSSTARKMCKLGRFCMNLLFTNLFDIFENAFFYLQVSVKLNTTDAGPGAPVAVTLDADPSSVAHLAAIDQSVLLLRSGNDVTADDVRLCPNTIHIYFLGKSSPQKFESSGSYEIKKHTVILG